MTNRMPAAEWERAQSQLMVIAAAIRCEEFPDLERDIAAARQALEVERNPLQAGIHLMSASYDLAGVPALWHRVVVLATELIEYHAVDGAAHSRATETRPIASDPMS